VSLELFPAVVRILVGCCSARSDFHCCHFSPRSCDVIIEFQWIAWLPTLLWGCCRVQLQWIHRNAMDSLLSHTSSSRIHVCTLGRSFDDESSCLHRATTSFDKSTRESTEGNLLIVTLPLIVLSWMKRSYNSWITSLLLGTNSRYVSFDRRVHLTSGVAVSSKSWALAIPASDVS
jgi:hypothetical protein